MLIHLKEIRDEREYYERQNKRLAVEDLLREISGKSKIYQKQIQENEARIERLYFCSMEFMMP